MIKGPSETIYHGGHYHGKLIFPPEYPYKPPSIMMLTPNGRFATNTRLCLSMSDFHPETWVPAWSVASILNGVLSFMLEETSTVGSIDARPAERRRLALRSHAFNRKTPLFCELFPQLVGSPEDDETAADDGAGADGADGGVARIIGGLGAPLLLVGVGVVACAALTVVFAQSQ